MRTLRLTLEYDGTGFRGWARQPGEADGRRDASGGARRRLPELGRARRRRAYRHRRPCGRPGREPRRRGWHRRSGACPRRSTPCSPTTSPCSRPRRRRTASTRGSPRRALVPLRRSRRGRRGRRSAPRGRSGGRVRSSSTAFRRPPRRSSAPRLHGVHADGDPARGLHPRRPAAAWERRGDELHFTVTADSFLRHMVRTLVGTMLEQDAAVGRTAARGPPARGGRRDRAAAGARRWSSVHYD